MRAVNILIQLIRQRKNCIVLIRYLIRNHYDLEEMDKYGNTPLLWACKCNKPEIVALLLAAGANVHHRDKSLYGDTATSWAVYSGHTECTALLLRYGACIDQQTILRGHSLLMWAYKQDRYKDFVMLLYSGCNIRLRNKFNHDIIVMCKKHEYKYILDKYIAFLRMILSEYTRNIPLFEPELIQYIINYY